MTIITIDGPSASGKGTIAKEIAKQLNFYYLDSGALYRIIAYITLKNNYTLLDMDKIVNDFHNTNIIFQKDNILLNANDISQQIKNEEIGALASKLATKSDIRNELLIWQKNYAVNKNLVTDGRDMGTIVFPHAVCKIFLIADINKRALRRYLQLLEQNKKINQEEVLQALIQRDDRDKNRSLAPLIAASDAFIIDNTDLTIDETVAMVLQHFNSKIVKE